MKMTELTKELNARGVKAQFAMSGGNVGTIYLGEADSEGFFEFAIGPGNYYGDEMRLEDICWGIDGAEEATYYTALPEDFTPAKVAELIITDYREARR